MANDVQSLFQARWSTVIETPFDCPLYLAESRSGLYPPYAVSEYAGKPIPINAGRFMTENTVRVTVYSPDERQIEAIFTACGLGSKVPTGFHRANIGNDDVQATIAITDYGLHAVAADPPMGGGKCLSRVVVFRMRTGAK